MDSNTSPVSVLAKLTPDYLDDLVRIINDESETRQAGFNALAELARFGFNFTEDQDGHFTGPPRALSYAAMWRSLVAWQRTDEHKCGACEESGYGACEESVALILEASVLQNQALENLREGV